MTNRFGSATTGARSTTTNMGSTTTTTTATTTTHANKVVDAKSLDHRSSATTTSSPLELSDQNKLLSFQKHDNNHTLVVVNNEHPADPIPSFSTEVVGPTSTAFGTRLLGQEEEEDETEEQSPQQPRERKCSSILFCCCCCGWGRWFWERNRWSLSRAPTTPRFVTILVPLLSLLTHYIFYYGQTEPMWHLHLSQQVDLWANATNLESKSLFQTIGLPEHNLISSHDEKQVKTFSYWYAIQELWKAKHMPGKFLPRAAAVLLVVFSGIWPHLKLILLNLTWFFARQQHRRTTRMFTWLSTLGKWSLADVLVVCVMVGVLHLDWLVDPESIRTGLITNLPFCLQVLKSLYSASDICTMLLKNVDCHVHHKSWKRWSECKACVGLVKTALEHPEKARDTFQGTLDGIDMSGGGHVTLRVLGLHGIYAFCGAVILSILISLLVDILDGCAHRDAVRRHQLLEHHRQQQQLEQEQQLTPYNLQPNGGRTQIVSLQPVEMELEPSSHHENDDSDIPYGVHDPSDHDDGDDTVENGIIGEGGGNMLLLSSEEDVYQQLLSSSQPHRHPLRHRSLWSLVWSLVKRYVLLLVCVVTAGVVGLGISSNTIERHVHGAIPQVLKDVLGIIWSRNYSLWTLVQTTGAAGGMDYMLMATFGLFVIVGPAVRALLCLVAALGGLREEEPVPSNNNIASSSHHLALEQASRRRRLRRRRRRKLLATIELVGAFCAWEVFAVAVGMVDMLMPAITSTVVMRPELCSSVSEDGTCLQVNFDLQGSFFVWVLGGGMLLIAVTNLAFGSNGRRPKPSTPTRTTTMTTTAETATDDAPEEGREEDLEAITTPLLES